MIRVFFFLLKAIIIVVAAVWMADRAGRLSFEWEDVVVEMPAALAFGAAALLAWISYQAAKFISALRHTPRIYRMHARLRANRQGQKMLSEALSAFGAQNSRRGVTFLEKAEKLLGSSQVIDFVKAQAGVPIMEAPKASVPAMAENSSPYAWRQVVETRLKEGALDEALATAEAFSAKFPNLPLPKKLLFDVQIRRHAYEQAATALEALRVSPSFSRKEWRAAKAALMAERARESLSRGHGQDAFEFAMQADRLVPRWVPALVLAARALSAQNKPREAAALIERAWEQAPHEQLGDVYLATKAKNDIQKAEMAEKMCRRSRDHIASRILLARAYMHARLWGQARLTLKALAEENPDQEVFELLAGVEEMESGDRDAAAEWRSKGLAAPPDEAWVCNSCHQPHAEWQGLCASCHSFNSLIWQTPLHKGQIASST